MESCLMRSCTVLPTRVLSAEPLLSYRHPQEDKMPFRQNLNIEKQSNV